MKSARFGAMFFGMGLTMTRGKHMNAAAMLTLGVEMNEYTRFVAMPMRGHGNVTGADAVTSWLTGYPFGVDFSRGYPRYNPGEYTTIDLLTRGEVDAVLVLAADPGATMPKPAIDHMARVPTIVLDPKVTHTSQLARVHITTAVTGISAPGTVYRMDEVPLHVRPSLQSPYPTDEEVIGAHPRSRRPQDRRQERRARSPRLHARHINKRGDRKVSIVATLKADLETPLEVEASLPRRPLRPGARRHPRPAGPSSAIGSAVWATSSRWMARRARLWSSTATSPRSSGSARA